MGCEKLEWQSPLFSVQNFFHRIGSNRTLVPRALTFKTQPDCKADSLSRHTDVMRRKSSIVRSRCCRMSTTDGRTAPVSASISGKSRSSVNNTRDCLAARLRMPASTARWQAETLIEKDSPHAASRWRSMVPSSSAAANANACCRSSSWRSG